MKFRILHLSVFFGLAMCATLRYCFFLTSLRLYLFTGGVSHSILFLRLHAFLYLGLFSDEFTIIWLFTEVKNSPIVATVVFFCVEITYCVVTWRALLGKIHLNLVLLNLYRCTFEFLLLGGFRSFLFSCVLNASFIFDLLLLLVFVFSATGFFYSYVILFYISFLSNYFFYDFLFPATERGSFSRMRKFLHI